MKYSHKLLIGGILKGLGLILMGGSFIFTIATQHPDLAYLSDLSTGSLGIIFVGALTWLFGAHIAGRKSIIERYWWIRKVD